MGAAFALRPQGRSLLNSLYNLDLKDNYVSALQQLGRVPLRFAALRASAQQPPHSSSFTHLRACQPLRPILSPDVPPTQCI